MEPKQPNDREIFEDIIAHEDIANDTGVISFGESIKEYEEYLRDHYIKTGRAEIPRDEIEEAEREVSQGWPFFEHVARLSGRLQIASDEDDETLVAIISDIAIADDEGEIIHEDEAAGVRFCVVDGARLESSRIVIDPIRDDEGVLRDVRVSYEFKIPLDDDEDILFYARPDDLYHHVYDEVSSVEARTRLQYKWPREFEALESIILGDSRPLPERITVLAAELRDSLQNDEFRKYVEVYVNEELALNRERPYAVTIQHELDVLGDIEAEDSTWMPLRIEEGVLNVDLYRPEVRFTRASATDPTAIEACVYGETFNEADGDNKPELIAVPTEHLRSFRSTWAQDSIASLALKIIQDEMTARLVSDTDNPINLTYAPMEATEESEEDTEYIDQLELIESTLVAIRREVEAEQKVTYITPEAAQEAAYRLADKLTSMLNGTIARSNIEVEVMGGALRTNLREGDSEDDDHQREQFWYSPDADEPVRELKFGESIKGIVDPDYPIRPFTKSEEDESGNVVYRSAPYLAVRLPERATGEVMMGGMLFSRIVTEEWIAVSLDNELSADIKIMELERERASRVALEEAAKTYGEGSPLMRRILALEAAFKDEDESSYVSLKPSRLAGFPRDLLSHIGREKYSVRSKVASPALKALENILYGRIIISKSDVYTKTVDGFVMDEERTGYDAAWAVFDFKLSDDGHEIMMFVGSVKQPDVSRYIPLSSIASLNF